MLLWLLDIKTNYVRSPSSPPFALKYNFYPRKMVVTYNASVTVAFRFFYDVQIILSIRLLQGYPVIIIRIHGHRSLYDFDNSALWQILKKNQKSVARRYIAGWSHDPLTGTARWSWGHHKNLDNNMIVGSWDNRREPALISQGHRAIYERISWRLHYVCAVFVQSLQSLCKDCPVLSPKEIQGDHKEYKHLRRSYVPWKIVPKIVAKKVVRCPWQI